MKKFFILILIQGVLMAASLSEMKFKSHTVPIIFEESEYLPIVSLQLVFKGAGHLFASIDGEADMASKLLNEGTKKEGSVGFATTLDNHAIELSAHVGRESFVIELSALKSEFAYGVSRLVDLLKDINYTPEALEQIKNQKMGWLLRKQSDFDYIAGLNLRKILFKGEVLARPYDGTIQSIQALKLSDLKQFIQTHLGYNNLIGVVGGDLSLEEAKGALSNIMEVLPLVEQKRLSYCEASSLEESVVTPEETTQAHIFFGAPFHFRYNAKEQYLAKIAEYMLGGAGFGSRLMEEIRVKRGLTYGIYASLRRTKVASYLSGYMQTKISTQEEAKALIRSVVEHFVQEGITQEELDATKEFLLGSEPLRLETLSQRLGRAYNNYYYERPLSFDVLQREKIKEVTLEEVNAFIFAHQELKALSFSIVTQKEDVKK